MRRTGYAELRLCEGYVPQYREMVKLSAPITEILIEEFGTEEVVKRFSDPCWFQCLACALGFEHNYTGATTVTLKALKEALLNENLGITVVGGKGKLSRNTPREIINVGDNFSLKESKISDLTYASKMTAKTDSVCIQDSFNIYFHSMILDEKGNFAVVNQGMNVSEQLVRRYHWLNTDNFVEEPHTAINGRGLGAALDLTAKESKGSRKTITDIVHDEKSEKIQKTFLLLDRSDGQKKLVDFIRDYNIIKVPFYLMFPKRLNLEALRVAKEAQNFEEILGAKGMGPSTMRGLAYISSLVYGSKLSWKDPQRYCYAYGTKCGKPWMVERKNMRESAAILRNAIEQTKIGEKERLQAIRRLNEFL